jgi:hypothetical protein
MYTCLLRVHHVSPHGAAYTRVHLVRVTTTIANAVRDLGAHPPDGIVATLRPARGFGAEIVYGSGLPVIHDPAALVLHLDGLAGGLYLTVPYAASSERVAAAALARLGVKGQVGKRRQQCGAVTHYWLPVPCAWPRAVCRAVSTVQRSFRQKRRVLTQGLEPWTICS